MAQVNDFVMDLPWEYYQAIGQFLFRYAQLEAQMHEILWRTMDLDNRKGRVLTIGMPFKAVRAALKTAIGIEMKNEWIPAEEKKIKQQIFSLVSDATEFETLRNRISHGCWQSKVHGNYTDARLLYMKNKDEKYLAIFDPSLDDAAIQKQCAKLRLLNVKAQLLILSLSSFRGIPASALHDKKYAR